MIASICFYVQTSRLFSASTLNRVSWELGLLLLAYYNEELTVETVPHCCHDGLVMIHFFPVTAVPTHTHEVYKYFKCAALQLSIISATPITQELFRALFRGMFRRTR